MTYDIVEGTTDTLQFQLLENGSPIDITNMTVTLLLEDRTGTIVSPTGTLTPFDKANGRLLFIPNSTSTLVAANGPYYARWKLVNAAGQLISYVPTSIRDVWNIVGQ